MVETFQEYASVWSDSEQFPVGKRCGLADVVSRGRTQIPDRCLPDQESLSVGRDANALVIIDKPLTRRPFQQPGPFVSMHGFRGQPRWGLPQLVDGDPPQHQRGSIAIVEDGIGLDTMGDNDEGSFEKGRGLFLDTSRPREQLGSHPMPVRIKQDLGVSDPAMQKPWLGRDVEVLGRSHGLSGASDIKRNES